MAINHNHYKNIDSAFSFFGQDLFLWRLMIKSDKADFNILFFKVQKIKDLGFSFLLALPLS